MDHEIGQSVVGYRWQVVGYVQIADLGLCKDKGSSERDAENVKNRHYFILLPDLLLRKVKPPFVPIMNHLEDVSNFEEEFTSEKPQLTPPKVPRLLSDEEQIKLK